ncbi:hypothetical protein [Desulfotignum balticum]|uniref:hypothetical protein n=1 Tax=Desulfotignum balticum TaxID=115781 RepID=UPI0004629720|nr:hypothetical protein [Desulfotignum balticum]
MSAIVALGGMILTNVHAGGKVPNGTAQAAFSARPLSENHRNLKNYPDLKKDTGGILSMVIASILLLTFAGMKTLLRPGR